MVTKPENDQFRSRYFGMFHYLYWLTKGAIGDWGPLRVPNFVLCRKEKYEIIEWTDQRVVTFETDSLPPPLTFLIQNWTSVEEEEYHQVN